MYVYIYRYRCIYMYIYPSLPYTHIYTFDRIFSEHTLAAIAMVHN